MKADDCIDRQVCASYTYTFDKSHPAYKPDVARALDDLFDPKRISLEIWDCDEK